MKSGFKLFDLILKQTVTFPCLFDFIGLYYNETIASQLLSLYRQTADWQWLKLEEPLRDHVSFTLPFEARLIEPTDKQENSSSQ